MNLQRSVSPVTLFGSAGPAHVPTSPWRRVRDSNSRPPFEDTRFPSERHRPLGQLSKTESQGTSGTVDTGLAPGRWDSNPDLHARLAPVVFIRSNCIQHRCDLNLEEGTRVERATELAPRNCFRDSRTCQCTNPSVAERGGFEPPVEVLAPTTV